MNVDFPNALYSCAQTRELEQKCMEEFNLAGIVLMKRAGRAAFDYALKKWPSAGNVNTGSWIVLCGSGNNAGDGYIFAALAAQRKHKVIVYHVVNPKKLSGDALIAYQFAEQEGVEIRAFVGTPELYENSIIIDALLGTGLSGNVRTEYLEAIDWANRANKAILSLDIPSGLCGDTGVVMGAAIKATTTVTFISCKVGLFTGRGPALVGDLIFCDLDVPSGIFDKYPPTAKRIDLFSPLCPRLAPRQQDAHKGDSGHLMVIGGDIGYGGAAIMAAEAAAYSGAGMVSLATQAIHVAPALARRPDLMVVGVTSGQELEPLLTRPTVLVVGPGLGLSPWSEQLLQQVLASGLPMVIDADALTILAQGRLTLSKDQIRIFTPHPGEAARMLGCSAHDVQQDRIAAIKKVQEKFGGVVLLKGAGTLIFDGSTLIVANVGNCGLATAGSGDVLSGIIGACLAQGLGAIAAVQLATCIHGAAADKAVEVAGVHGLLASELSPYVREIMHNL